MLLTNPFKTHNWSMLARYKRYPMGSDPEIMYMISISDSGRTFISKVVEAGEKLAAWLGIALGMILLGVGVTNSGTTSKGRDSWSRHADRCEDKQSMREAFENRRETEKEQKETREYNSRWGRGD